MCIMEHPALSGWLILVTILGFLLYTYTTRHKNYWRRQNIPYEKLSLYSGATLQYMIKPFHLVEQDLYRKHGRLFGSFEDGKPVLYVAEPELLKTIFVRDFSLLNDRKIMLLGDSLLDNMMFFAPLEKWRKLRTATSPAMTTSKLRKINSLVHKCAKISAAYLKRSAEENRSENIKRLIGHYTLDVISGCTFGAQLESFSPEAEAFVTAAQKALFAEITPSTAFQALLLKFFHTLHVNNTNKESFHFVRNLALTILRRREKTDTTHEDFLQMMMNAKETQPVLSAEDELDTERKLFDVDSDLKSVNGYTPKDLTEEEAIAQCVQFFLAGQDTSSTLISFTLYLLALHPQVQDKLRDEVDACFSEHGSSPSYDVISKLCFLNAVVSETLRMFPPGTRTERTSHVDDYVLGDTGIKIMKHGTIIIPIYSMHRDPQFFPDPDNFIPERFSPENITSIIPYTFLPFGAGPRNCIGTKLAIQLVKTCILHAIHSVRFVCTSETNVPLQFRPGYGILSAKDITLGIRKRL